MLPPVEEVVFRNNPQFAELYTNITANKLNTAGATKHHNSEKEWNANQEELKKERIRNAKHHLIRNAVLNLEISPSTSKSSRSSTNDKLQPSLPVELLELILLFSSHINAPPLENESEELIQSSEQWTSFDHYLPQLAALVAAHLQKRLLLLARILSPTTNPSYLHRTIPKICPTVTSLRTQTIQLKEELAARRNALVAQTLSVLERYQQATSLAIAHLEQTTHGALSRHLKAKSEYLAAQALSVSLLVKEKETTAKKLIYTERVQSALRNYMQHLRIEQERAGERARDAERVLWGYGVGREDGGEKEKVLKEIAKMYGKLKGEVRSVERDVGRLKGK